MTKVYIAADYKDNIVRVKIYNENTMFSDDKFRIYGNFENMKYSIQDFIVTKDFSEIERFCQIFERKIEIID